MSPWTKEERDLFDACRTATTPTPAERDRVEQALASKLGVALGAATAALHTSAPPPPILHAGVALPSAFKVAGGAALMLATAAGVVGVRRMVHPPLAAHVSTAQIGPAENRSPVEEPPEAPNTLAVEAPTAVAPPGHPSRAPSRDAVPPLGQETELLKGAQRALRDGQPARAMALLDEHARRFPNGILREERKAARVIALCASGREREAKVEVDAFAREWPSSPLLERVRAACDGHPGPKPGAASSR